MKLRRCCCFGLLLVLLVSFISCGARKSNSLSFEGKDEYDYGFGAPMEDVTYVEDIYESPQKEYESGGTGIDASMQEKILLTVTLRAQTKEYDSVLAAIRAEVKARGGYEESLRSNGRSYGSAVSYCRSAYMTLRIPAERLEEFLAATRRLVNVVDETNAMSNATEEYYDLAARVSVLEEERVAYEAMLSRAVNVEEVLIIKDRLYDVISEIEAAKTRMKVIDSRAAYSTVHLTLEEVVDYEVITTPKTTFGSRISSAFTRSWKNFAEGFQDFTVWLVGALPTLLVILVLAGAGVTAAVLSRRNRKKRLSENKKDEEY